MREQLADPLFVKTAQGMLPTPRAESLVEPIREALQSLRRVSASVQSFVPSEARRSFRICMTDGSHITLLPRLLKRLRADAPSVRIDATPINDETFAQQLLERAAVKVLPGRYLARDTEQGNPGENRVRLALVAELENCVEAAERIAHAIKQGW